MNYDVLMSRIYTFGDRIKSLNGEVYEIIKKQPASDKQIKDIEEQLHVCLPGSFKKVLLEFSARFRFRWFLPDEIALPEKFRGIFSGDMHWDLSKLVELEQDRLEWIRVVFPDPHDPYDAVWHDKLSFYDVGNGDFLSFDLSQGEDPPIVYLSHDGCTSHGCILANNFIDLLDRWSQLGFVGGEDWQWMPFTSDAKSGILPNSTQGIEFRKFLNLKQQN